MATTDAAANGVRRSPGPLVLRERDHVGDNIFTASAPHRRIANTYGDDPESRANAEFIVRAWNAHDDLLAACKGLLIAIDESPGALATVDAAIAARVAIAKAESPSASSGT